MDTLAFNVKIVMPSTSGITTTCAKVSIYEKYLVIHNYNSVFSEDTCASPGTLKKLENGVCSCKSNFQGFKCNECIEGYTGKNCDECETGFHQVVNKCQVCGCAKSKSDGTCDQSGQCNCFPNFAGMKCNQCKKGHVGKKCNQCDAKYFMNDNGECEIGTCNQYGTRRRLKSGKCICKSTHQGGSCDECAGEHSGVNCEGCAAGYFKHLEKCKACNCNPDRSRSLDCDQEGKCSCSSNFGGDRCNGCQKGYFGDTCDSCKGSYYMSSNSTCISGICNRFGTIEHTPKGQCVCHEGFHGDRCEFCDQGYVSSLPVNHEAVCDICLIGYFKDGNTCKEGTCDKDGTQKIDSTGRCHCKSGYAGAQCNECAEGHSGDNCDHCTSGFAMDKDGICHEGDCNPVGTQNRTTNGKCNCTIGFKGVHCDQCSNGYIGLECDQCDEHFAMVDGECHECILPGTEHLFGIFQYHTDGTCKCMPEFEGLLCQDCKPGHYGSLCQYCNETTYKSSNRECIVGECHANGTRHRNEFGSCVCNPGYGGDRCDHCRAGTFGDNCENCEQDYIKNKMGLICIKGQCHPLKTENRTEDGQCICKSGFVGARCDECPPGARGEFCDICPDGMYKFGSYCKQCNCNKRNSVGAACDGTGQCQCRDRFAGKTCDECTPQYQGDDCSRCSDSYHEYPANSTTCQSKQLYFVLMIKHPLISFSWSLQ